ncbi:MAG: D-alanine--D-alanine ligase [Verrucomicrobia bacterium]|nr:D-alanine--D-alanine ligase [Verrucomicrobiota bacterium]MBV9674339.1 D-alanine--D-alanine ligase [Verrucomicrobiota bacterium]
MNSSLMGRKITVLCGGISSERDVSLRSGRAVCRALQALGVDACEWPIDKESFDLPHGTQLVFNCLHGTFGEDGSVQQILEARNVPYTGEGIPGSHLAFDKIASKRRFQKRGVPTAGFVALRKGEKLDLALPLVVKVPCQGSSVGVYSVQTLPQLRKALDQAFAQSEEILVEQFIPGRELTVGVLGTKALPVIEIRPEGGFYSYENKYTWTGTGGFTEHLCPARLNVHETRLIQETALAAHRSLDLSVYSRVDIILANDGIPYVLEVNTIPGMTETSLLPEAAAAMGMSMSKLCEEIVRLSIAKTSFQHSPAVQQPYYNGLFQRKEVWC